MGNVIDYARLSNAAYEPNGGAPGNGWTAIYNSPAAGIGSDSGYYGVAYYHQATGELVIAHRGTDPLFGALRVWQDANSDGISQAVELKTLEEHGITSLDAIAAPAAQATANGNQHLQQGSFTKADGSTAQMEDIWFRINPSSTRQDNPLDVSAALKVGAGGTANDGIWRDAA